ncbi:MAG: FimV/HubP family polar landmark protein [Hydrogenophaga sp.]|uniref:FimV/HubP family polar landmark protein n=1 Tax=Hydrogenophaga sp. TaxID=1904254 RepID=UPI003D14C90D
MHAVAAAALLCTTLLHPSDAQALALGRVVVQSALGEPLRAEIEVPDINSEEASSLRVGLASSDAFRAAGVDYGAALASVQISLQRRADGRAYLRLTSSRPITEPFVDLIVEANWSSGRIVRDYTLLFDPPNLRPAPQPVPLAPGVAAPPPSTAQAPRPIPPIAPAPAVRPPQPASPAASAPAPAPAPIANPAPAPAPAPVAASSGGGQVRVQAGDTAGRIAAANRPANVSLDQMLVAMLRANPNAFIGGNVNRVKAGAVLDLPAQQEAAAINPGEARQTIAAQSRDFNEFRRRLAGSAPDAGVAAADRQAAGQIQTEVKDAKPAAPSADKLTLSKEAAAAAGQASREDQIAKERQAKDASNRVAELSRNIEELSKLGAGTAPGSSAATPTAPAAPAAPAAAAPPTPPAAEPPTSAAPAVTLPTTPPPMAAASEPAAAQPVAAPAEPAASAPSTTPAPVAAPRPVPVPLPDEPSFMDQLRDNPLVLPLAGGLLALLAAFGFYRLRQRKHGSSVDSSFLESRLQPDSFFGSSGGQRIDTAESVASGSSMVYSPSQLDAAGDVDPVAEADVYLAYGRDLQAEEILKEAMRSTPTRVAIHNKLLEIYAKRRDARAFEVVATEAYGLTQGQGPEWEHACEIGRELDPSNPLYQPGGVPAVKAGMVAGLAGAGMNTMPFGSSTLAETANAGTPSDMANLDLDLDFSLDEPSAPAPLDASGKADLVAADAALSGMDDLNATEALTSQRVEDKQTPPSMSMDFDLDFPSGPTPLGPDGDAAAAGETTSLRGSLDQPEPMSPDLDVPAPAAAPSQPVALPEMMSFNLNDINLDLDATPSKLPQDDNTSSGRLTEENPLETKLSLAEEFRAIGDFEGARSLAEEVLAEASGTLKTKAGTFLADLA